MIDPHDAELLDEEERQKLAEGYAADNGGVVEMPVDGRDEPLPDMTGEPPPIPSTLEPQKEGPKSELDKSIALARDAAMADIGGGSSSKTDSELLSAAPAWYKPLMAPPPKPKNPALGNILGALLKQAPKSDGYYHGSYLHGTDGTPHQVREIQDPNKAGREALGDAVGGALSRDAATENYNANQSAAVKQAGLMKTLRDSSRTGAGANVYGTLLREKGLQDQEAAAAKKLQDDRDANDPNSAVTKSTRDAFVKAGLITPEDADTMTAAQLRQTRVNLAQGVQRDFRGNEFDRRREANINQTIGKEDRSNTYAAAKENRDQQAKDYEAAIPGRAVGTVVNGVPVHAPDKAAIEKAKMAKVAGDVIVNGAKRLQEIQDKLEEERKLGGATGLFERWVGSPEAQQLLAEGENIRMAMGAQIRSPAFQNMGVPQHWEQMLVNSVNPQAGSIEGFFRGKAAWKAMGDYYGQLTDKALTTYGYPPAGQAPQGQQLAIDNPATAAPHFAAPPVQKYHRPGTAAPPTEDATAPVPTVNEALPVTPSTGPKVPNAASPPGTGGTAKFKVGGKVRDLRPDQVDFLRKQLGDAAVVAL